MFSTKCLSPGFSRFLSATTTHVAQALKGTPAAVIPTFETVQSPPAALTSQSLVKTIPTGNMVATTTHIGKERLSKFSWNSELIVCTGVWHTLIHDIIFSSRRFEIVRSEY